MKTMTKKEFEAVYVGATVQDSDINKYVVVFGNAWIPISCYTFKVFESLKDADRKAELEKQNQKTINQDQ